MGYLPQLGDVSADTAAARALHQAALAVIAARQSGNADAAGAARRAFDAMAGTNAQRAAALKIAEATPSGFLEQLRGSLTSAGKLAALVLGAIVLGPHVIGALGRAGRHTRLNPGRRRRRRSRRRRG